jgi:hypothetical protein
LTALALPQLEGAHLLTNSRMQTAKTCPRKHHYSYNLGIRPAGDVHFYRFGGNTHHGLDRRAKGDEIDDAILAAVAGYEDLPGWCQTEDQVHDWRVERETIATLLSGYFWMWEREDVRPELRPIEIIASEISFDLPILNPDTKRPVKGFRLAGKIDKIVRLADGRVAVMEHKTTTDSIEPTSDYWLKLKMDHQISTYFYAARELGHDVQTVLYDVIRKPGIEPRQIPVLDEQGRKIVLDGRGIRQLKEKYKQDGSPAKGHGEPYASVPDDKKELGWFLQTRRETPEEFGARLLQDLTDRPDFYYARQEIPRLDADIDDFCWELWQQQQQIRDARKYGRHFRNTAACTLMGRCAYLDVCSTGGFGEQLPAAFQRVSDIHPELAQGAA